MGMIKHITNQSQQHDAISAVFKKAISERVLGPDDLSISFYNFTALAQHLKQLKNAFPTNTLHSFAVKANPLIKLLSFLKLQGLGVEVASSGEMALARAAGFQSHNIVYDSPAKTQQDLFDAFSLGTNVNADNFDECDRIASLIPNNYSGKVGLRVNPQVVKGQIATTTVADTYSKFGEAIANRKRILELYNQYPWLNSIHVHCGSQGSHPDDIIIGIKAVLNLAQEINQEIGTKQITSIDIGGGLPVRYTDQDQTISFSAYADKLQSHCPTLFTGEFNLITEFGRAILANHGWTASKVEYVKQNDNKTTLITHLGADMFLRPSYCPQDWQHEIIVLDKAGQRKNGLEKLYQIAGPLCFAGDYIKKDCLLPEVDVGDYIVILDTGAYTLSMWSRYNSRLIPKQVGYQNDGSFEVLKERETLSDIISFWQ